MMTSRLVVLASIALALAGCGTMRGVEPEESAPVVAPSTPQPVSDVETLLSYFQRVKTLSAPALGKEHDSARQAYVRTRSEFNRVRLAIILSLPSTSFNDEPQALELLDPVVRNQQAPLHGLAFLLAAHLQEQRRLGSSVQSLQKKLDALKSLERAMIEREPGGSKKR